MKNAISKDMMATLLKINKGKLYKLRGDKSIGLELNLDLATRNKPGKNCRSLAPLMRRGFIEFADVASDVSRFYRVRITEEGIVKLCQS